MSRSDTQILEAQSTVANLFINIAAMGVLGPEQAARLFSLQVL